MTRLSRRQLLCNLPSTNGQTTALAVRGPGRAAPLPNDPGAFARDFDWGTTQRASDGRIVRVWDVVAENKTFEVTPGVTYDAWTYNGRVPGPTLRCREGERLRINFTNGSTHPHTMHFHGIHKAEHDGVPGIGPGNIEPGESFTYEFDAEPFGLHLYHCHTRPLAEHIAKGLYGVYIVDPAGGRPAADELVMVLNGFDTNFDRANELYAVNTVPFAYERQPIRLRRGELVRIYLVNVLEYDLLSSFHIDGHLFRYYPTGTSLEPAELTDTVFQCQGQRGVIEVRFPEAGRFAFHAHVSEFAQLGAVGLFEVFD